ncbi:helix-turn-helix domain-containing protein [Sphingomonas panacisoli]|nr:helix-turn-helix domain-containing protein [Sphingomonas panacisoli]
MVQMRRHGAGSAGPSSGKFVVSALPPGESAVQSLSPSIKVVIEGEEIHEIDGRPYVVRPGQMLLVDRGPPSRATVRRNQQTLGLCIYLPSSGNDGFDPNLVLPRAILQSTDSNSLGRLIADYAARLHRGRGDAQLPATMMAQVSASLGDVLSSAGRSIGALDVKKASTRQEIYHRLEVARALLHGNIDRVVPLDELARSAGLSGFHLTRYFAAAYGAPPARYHRTLRLERAAQRLRVTNLAITEIALDAGYAELSAFTHAFRREYGCAPTAIERPRKRPC